MRTITNFATLDLQELNQIKVFLLNYKHMLILKDKKLKCPILQKYIIDITECMNNIIDFETKTHY